MAEKRNNRQTGNNYEQTAAEFLERNGIRIIEKNFRIRQGEIDLIGYDGAVLVFIEVKYRRDAKAGDPAEAVTLKKQQQICKVAEFYLGKHNLFNISCRYDVVAICGETLNWYQNAFPHRRR